MGEAAEALLAWAEAHAGWIAAVMLLVAFLEAVPLVGLLLPGSTLLFGLGVLSGMAGEPALPLLLAGVAGSVAGQALGYRAGRALGPAAVRRRIPPSQRRVYARAVLAIRRFGFWAVVAARFVSPLRAVAPLVAAVTRMPEARFQAANIASALVWVTVLVLPGHAAGRAASPEQGAVALVVLWLVPVALAGWVAWRARRAAR